MAVLTDGNLDGYQKKKWVFRLPMLSMLSDCVCRYVAKIIFTYILGYKADVGHMEAVSLISSPKYSEKQIVRVSLREERSKNILTRGLSGVPRRYAANARELGLPTSRCQLHQEGPGV